jgi:hypothetical protein
MPNRIVNFQMQKPGEMANPQVVGVQQQNRLSLAERLRKYGLDQDSNGPQSFADSFNQQMYGRRPQDETTQATPESNQSRLDKYYSSPDASAGYTPDGGAQQRQSIMNRYNAKGGGSQTGYSLSSGQKPSGMFGGAGGAISRGASNVGGALKSAAGGFGKFFA